MRVGLLGPASIARLRPRLDAGGEDLPDGMGGTPVTLLAEALLDAGHEVALWTLDPRAAAPVAARGPGLEVHVVPLRPGGRGRDAYRAERRGLEDALHGARVDVLHAHWMYEYALAALAVGGPVLVTAHDWPPAVVRHLRSPYWAVKAAMAAAVLARRPPLTAPSPYLAGRLRRAGQTSPAVVPNGLDASAFAVAPRPRPSAAVVVAVAAGFSRLKNTATLLRAHPLLRDAVPDAELHLVGPEHEPDGPAAAWARERGLDVGVRFVGRVPHADVLARVDAADVLVHPALEESFGMVLVEAMARGTPVVGGARSGAVPWVLDRGRAGRLVDVRRPEAVAAATAGLLSSPSAWAAASDAAWRSVRRRFPMEVVRDGYLATYEEVRRRRGPGAARGGRGPR